MKAPDITADEWLQAVQEATRERIERPPKDAITIEQFALRLRVSGMTASRKMRELVVAKLAESAGKFNIQAGSRIMPVPHYRLLKKK